MGGKLSCCLILQAIGDDNRVTELQSIPNNTNLTDGNTNPTIGSVGPSPAAKTESTIDSQQHQQHQQQHQNQLLAVRSRSSSHSRKHRHSNNPSRSTNSRNNSKTKPQLQIELYKPGDNDNHITIVDPALFSLDSPNTDNNHIGNNTNNPYNSANNPNISIYQAQYMLDTALNMINEESYQLYSNLDSDNPFYQHSNSHTPANNNNPLIINSPFQPNSANNNNHSQSHSSPHPHPHSVLRSTRKSTTSLTLIQYNPANINLLLCSSDQRTISGLSSYLTKSHYNLTVAIDNQSAKEILINNNTTIDLVLIDFELNNTTINTELLPSGGSLLDWILLLNYSIPVIMLAETDYYQLQSIGRSIRRGCADYLIKPISKPILLRSIRLITELNLQRKMTIKLKSSGDQYKQLVIEEYKRNNTTNIIPSTAAAAIAAVSASITPQPIHSSIIKPHKRSTSRYNFNIPDPIEKSPQQQSQSLQINATTNNNTTQQLILNNPHTPMSINISTDSSSTPASANNTNNSNNQFIYRPEELNVLLITNSTEINSTIINWLEQRSITINHSLSTVDAGLILIKQQLLIEPFDVCIYHCNTTDNNNNTNSNSNSAADFIIQLAQYIPVLTIIPSQSQLNNINKKLSTITNNNSIKPINIIIEPLQSDLFCNRLQFLMAAEHQQQLNQTLSLRLIHYKKTLEYIQQQQTAAANNDNNNNTNINNNFLLNLPTPIVLNSRSPSFSGNNLFTPQQQQQQQQLQRNSLIINNRPNNSIIINNRTLSANSAVDLINQHQQPQQQQQQHHTPTSLLVN